MKKPPCIRGLQEFKKGCPQKSWDGKEGCPAWKELIISKRGNPLEKETKAQCISEWSFEFQWATMGLLEGNQQAVESFRNGMLQIDNNGKAEPKPDPVTIILLNLIKDIQQRQIE